VHQQGPQFDFLKRPVEQSHLAIGFHGLPRAHKDRYILSLVHVILGANMSSRLFDEVREKRGLAYSIGTNVKFFQDTGAFMVHAGIDNEKVCQTLDIVLEQLQKIKEKAVPAAELRRAKEFFCGQTTLALEDTQDQMLWIGESIVSMGRINTLKEVIAQITKVSAADIARIARQVFRREGFNLALIGPKEYGRADFEGALERLLQ
jgi:predicted Zn-dependent peptidase